MQTLKEKLPSELLYLAASNLSLTKVPYWFSLDTLSVPTRIFQPLMLPENLLSCWVILDIAEAPGWTCCSLRKKKSCYLLHKEPQQYDPLFKLFILCFLTSEKQQNLRSFLCRKVCSLLSTWQLSNRPGWPHKKMTRSRESVTPAVPSPSAGAWHVSIQDAPWGLQVQTFVEGINKEKT